VALDGQDQAVVNASIVIRMAITKLIAENELQMKKLKKTEQILTSPITPQALQLLLITMLAVITSKIRQSPNKQM